MVPDDVDPVHRWTLPDREAALERAAATALDVLVVGGGATGAGVALDAASRGLSVALVEAEDLASGTSSRSSKLVHGGLRYLATGDLAMVAEGVVERDRTRRMAPHLVRPLPFLVPTDTPADRALLKAGLVAYDALSSGRRVAAHRRVQPEHVRDRAPTLRLGAVGGGYRYFDARTDDARLVLAAAQTARRLGALVVNHCRVTSVGAIGAEHRTVQVRDGLTGASAELRARWVVVAGGVWAERLRSATPAGDPGPGLVPARGAHLVLPRRLLPVDEAVVVPAAGDDGRRLFVVPWGEQVYVGTNDVPGGGDLGAPSVTPADAEYLLDAVRTAFACDARVEDAVGAWAGLRPLVADGSSGATSDLSRRHVVAEDPVRVLHVTGGKLTTWRRMAQDVVDHLVAADHRTAPCRTADLRLGASGPRRAGDARVRAVAADRGVDPVVASSLFHRHGDAAPLVLDACAAEDGGLEPLVPGLPYLVGEVRWAVRHELARTVDDVLQRRTRVSLRHAGAGGPAVARVADVLAEELGLDATARDAQVADYRHRVADERGPVPLAWAPSGRDRLTR